MYKVSKKTYALILFFFVTTAAKIVGMESKYKLNIDPEQLENMIHIKTSEAFLKYFNPCLAGAFSSGTFAKYYKQEKIKSKKAKLEKLKKEQAAYNTVGSWVVGSGLYVGNAILTYGGCHIGVPAAFALGSVVDKTAISAGIIACQELNTHMFGGPRQGRNSRMSYLKSKIAQLEEDTKDMQITEEK